MKNLKVENFSLEETLNSGQIFTYYLENNWWFVLERDKLFKVKQNGDILYYEGIKSEELIDFFSLDESLEEELKGIEDEILTKAIEELWGLRLIRQDLWQVIISFITSSMSNMDKIKKNLWGLCKEYGEVKYFEEKNFYTFPKEGVVFDEEKLRKIGFGYRAKYLEETSRFISKNPQFLEKLNEMNYNRAVEELQKLSGVGKKVADCICLFGLNKKEAFPVDVWINRILTEHYLSSLEEGKKIDDCIEVYFRGNKGLKQQYLFHYFRKYKIK